MLMSAQIITIAQHKGGAGKTTLAAHLAVTWAEAGQRVAILDTDCDPDLVDLVVPGNDDSIRSIRLLLNYLGDAVAAGRATLPQEPKDDADVSEFKAVPSIR